MKNTYIVYKHKNKYSNKIYIGITKYGDNPNLRWKNGFGYQDNQKFFSDIVKFGWDSFEHIVLAKELSEVEALQMEKEYIKLYNSVENGYNNNYGCGEPIGEAGRKKISQALIGKTKDKQAIIKQLQTKQERYGSQRGITAYVTSGIKVRCKETNDVFANISEANRWSHTNKVGECCKGLREHAGIHPLTGEKLTWEYAEQDAIVTISCEKDYITKKIQKILCIETEKIYNNASEAFRDTGVAACNILRVCKGERKTAGKYHWSFI